MKKCFLMILVFTVGLVPAAYSKSLPPEFSYTIYVEGRDAGKSTTKVTETSDRIIFDTETSVVYGEYKLELTSHTEADKNTYQVLEFTYDGEKPGFLFGGAASLQGDSVTGYTVENGIRYPVGREFSHERLLVLEDYVICHQVLLGRAYFQSGYDVWETGIFLPSTWNINNIMLGKAADAYIESDIDETTVSKIQIHMSGAQPYVSFFDNERGMPVYVAFPGSNTEVFLDEFFGDSPISRYRGPTGRTR